MSKNSELQNHYKYKQLYNTLTGKITSGEWMPDFHMPTERELCELYNISRVTVRDTLNIMEQEGYIYRRQGKGTFVANRPINQKLKKLYTLRESIKKNGMEPYNKVLSFSKKSATGKIQKELKLSEGELVYELVRCLYASSTPYAVETSYIPVKYYPNMTEQMISTNGLYLTMQTYNIIPKRAVEKLTAVTANKKITSLLNVKPSEMFIRDERTTFSDNYVIEYTVTTIKSNFFSYTIELE